MDVSTLSRAGARPLEEALSSQRPFVVAPLVLPAGSSSGGRCARTSLSVAVTQNHDLRNWTLPAKHFCLAVIPRPRHLRHGLVETTSPPVLERERVWRWMSATEK